MKTLSIIFYVLGSIALIVSCFLNSQEAMWWVGGAAVVLLIIGCFFQFVVKSDRHQISHDNDSFN